MPADVLLRATGVPLSRGPAELELRVGDIVLVEGPNGSGKTRLLRHLAGLPSLASQTRLAPTGARRAPTRDPDSSSTPEETIGECWPVAVDFLPQDPFDGLVGLTVAGEARLRNRPLPAALAAFRGRAATMLSMGEARRVGLHLLRDAPLMLLDEPMEGLDAAGRGLVRERIRTAAERGAVLIVDPSGVAADMVTRRIAFGAAQPPEPLGLPRAPGVEASGPAEPAGPSSAGTRRHGTPRLRFAGGAVARDPPLALPSLDLGPGFHVLRGPNGCGKTTLLLAVLGLLDASAGNHDLAPAKIHDKTIRPGHDARILLQRASDHFHRDTVAEELRGVDPTLLKLLPPGLLDRHPLTLSGGEVQQVALMACLGRAAGAYLLDEPEAHLDSAGWRLLGELMSRRLQAGAVILATTHDPRLAAAAHAILEWPNP